MAKSRQPLTRHRWYSARTAEELLDAVVPDSRSVRSKATQRRLRLCICAGLRRVWGDIRNEVDRLAVAVAEQVADRELLLRELRAIRLECSRQHQDRETYWSVVDPPQDDGLTIIRQRDRQVELVVMFALAEALNGPMVKLALTHVWNLSVPREAWFVDSRFGSIVTQDRSPDPTADIVRDLFGYPFQPQLFDPRWRTPTVLGLVESAVHDHDHLPILADALEEAGCTYPGILEHCRGPGPHVRGCWVLDLIRGR